eukprot:5310921-Ditylum_brightwellii.AAC.1
MAMFTTLALSSYCALTGGRLSGGETAQTNLASVSHNSIVAQLGITDGCVLAFGLFGQPLHPSAFNCIQAINA